jgi:uncharacterized membrane protein (DUF373 family)
MDAEPPQRKAHERMVQVFESVELILYGAIGVLLIVIALVALAGEVDNIVSYFVTDSPIIGLNFLIAAIIALELLMTVVGYMKTRSINLGLLLGAGLTAMIRGIIVFGYQPTDLQDFEVILLRLPFSLRRCTLWVTKRFTRSCVLVASTLSTAFCAVRVRRRQLASPFFTHFGRRHQKLFWIVFAVSCFNILWLCWHLSDLLWMTFRGESARNNPAMPAGRNTYVGSRFFTSTTPRTFLFAGNGVTNCRGHSVTPAPL